VLVTVRPPKGGKRVTVGQLYNVNVSVKVRGLNGRYLLHEMRRLCMPGDGNLNAPSASGPARG
jgi:hypothetical protein